VGAEKVLRNQACTAGWNAVRVMRRYYPPFPSAKSADELIGECTTESRGGVMRAAHFDLGEHVFVTCMATAFVQIDHRPADVEEGNHFGAIVRHDQRMDLARRLVDEASLLRDPVVLEVAPAALDHVADHRHGMTMPVQHARSAHA